MAVALSIRWLLDDLNLILSGDTIPRFREILAQNYAPGAAAPETAARGA